MISVKMLKPYYIKTDEECVRIILAYQYFAVVINQKVYQFIPIEAKEIRINRKTRKVENIDARFAFQKGKEILYMTMGELISLPDFLFQIHSIVKPYYEETDQDVSINEEKMTVLFDYLEQQNIRRLIDKALDEKDEKSFYDLVKLL